MKPKLLIYFSGGETSALMTKMILENKRNEYDIVVVFANTGRENEETLEFVQKCNDEFGFNVIWIEALVDMRHGYGIRHTVVDFKTASRKGKPFEDIIKKYGIPNRTSPYCSEYLKKYTIKSYAKSIGYGKAYIAIGFRSDEIDRMSEHKDRDKLIYPFISMWPHTKPMVNFWWSKQNFRLNLKGYQGNCKTCWKKSLRKLMSIAKENPEHFEWDIEMENKYENYIPESRKKNPNIKPPLRFFRDNLSANDILKMSQKPFTKSTDDTQITTYQENMFEGIELDSPNACEESCEAF